MMQLLISNPSISCVNPQWDMSNRPIIELLANWLDQAGFIVELIENKNDPNKLNLIAHSHELVNNNTQPGLVFSGHTDTVPIDEALWQTNPFELIDKNNRYYGLGSTDMKLFFAFVFEAIRTLNPKQILRPICIIATADEETTMAGAKTIAELKPFHSSKVIVGEPTSLKPVYAHKGMMTEAIIIHGQTGHSSDPGRGNNAIDASLLVLQALTQWRQKWQSQHQNLRFEVSQPTLNFGCIHGGDNPNRICGHCELQYDLRPLPGMDLDEIKQAIHQTATQALSNTEFKLEFKALFEGIPAFTLDPNSNFLHQAESITGEAGITVAFGTEAPFWQQLECDSIVLGPGSINQAHQANEYLEQANIKPMIGFIKEFIRHYCF